MQIVYIGDSLHEMPNPVCRKNKKTITNLSSAESAQRVVKIKEAVVFLTGYQIDITSVWIIK